MVVDDKEAKVLIAGDDIHLRGIDLYLDGVLTEKLLTKEEVFVVDIYCPQTQHRMKTNLQYPHSEQNAECAYMLICSHVIFSPFAFDT